MLVGSKAMCALNFTTALTFEIKLTGGDNNIHEIIIVTAAMRHRMHGFPMRHRVHGLQLLHLL